MSRKFRDGAIQIWLERDQQIIYKSEIFAISVLAVRPEEAASTEVKHGAFVAPRHIESQEDAFNYGLDQAEKHWPSKEGWQYNIVVDRAPIRFAFHTGLPQMQKNDGMQSP